MIGALRYFASRFLAQRYWPKIGAASNFVPDADRTFTVKRESRTFTVAGELRVFTVAAERRTFIVPGD